MRVEKPWLLNVFQLSVFLPTPFSPAHPSLPTSSEAQEGGEGGGLWCLQKKWGAGLGGNVSESRGQAAEEAGQAAS